MINYNLDNSKLFHNQHAYQSVLIPPIKNQNLIFHLDNPQIIDWNLKKGNHKKMNNFFKKMKAPLRYLNKVLIKLKMNNKLFKPKKKSLL